ncbi:MAG: flagellar protein FliS [Lachnospiraceae bacterium]|nr:flagellar protein FliS [Lachnospiraceae bacterium]
MTKELKQEYTLKVSQANPSEMIVILYEILLEYIEEARVCHGNQDLEGFRAAIVHATAVLRELSSSINFENEIAGNLLSLYVYCTKELSKASIHNSAEELYHAEIVIQKLHKTYIEVASYDKSSPVMKNTQTVYAGLTYGKESLVVHLNQNLNRGYTV